MVLTDVAGGVDVTFSLLNGSQFWASTGGPHITIAFNLDTTIVAGDVTILSPTPTPTGMTGEVGGDTSTLVSTPEPSTWAMMIIGFIGLGYAGFRKAKSARAIAA